MSFFFVLFSFPFLSDFGHFLGNFKSKFGINRERAAFVFTPEMAYAMGGKKAQAFKDFLDKSARAYRILRQHANTLELLFVLMVAAGMPELMKIKDIGYMRDKLCLDMTEKKVRSTYF